MSFVLVQVIVGGLLLGAVYALFSSGLTLVWGMMNIVNFAHGDFVMLGMYVAFVVYTVMGAGPLLGAPLAILLLATLGSVPGALVAGLLIGVIESLSSYPIGAVYKDIVVYALFLGFLWFRPQGLMGKL